MNFIFNPKSVAIIGASSKFGKWGQMILSNIVAGDFHGKIFPVHPAGEIMCDLPVYSSVLCD